MSEEELPESWVECTMGDIADVVGGGTPKASDPANFAARGHPWITPADLSRFRGVYIQRGSRDLSDQGLRTSSAKMVPADTVLMSSRAPIGYLAIAANPISTNQGFRSFICRPGVLPAFVYYWLMFSRAIIEDMGSGSTFNEISGSRCKEIPFRVAPPAEQKRIVAKVEELLAHVNAACERLALVPAILKRFRQAVLASACDGRLTEEWRTAIPVPPDAGLESSNEVEQADDTAPVPESWRHVTFGQVVADSLYGPRYPSSRYTSGGVPTIRTTDIDHQGQIILKKPPRIALSRAELHAAALQEGDLIVTRTGATIGKCALYHANIGPAIPSAYLIRFRLDKANVLPEFALLCFLSPAIQQLFGAGLTAVAQPNINARAISEFSLALPSIEEQHEIVRRVETLFKPADAIQKRVAAATVRAEKLTQAILGKAFRGEIVPTEAELARREGRGYEPASTLLERIRAESAGADTRADRRQRRPS